MARTPLLRSLARLARLHAEAEARGIEVKRLREERALAAPIGRRAFLGGMAAGAATLALPTRARAGSQPRIAIVGAGIAGLNCALTLADNGLSSTVYESSGRIGGRMYSNMGGYWDDAQVSEWGGELVDSGHKEIQALARRFGLGLTDLKSASPNGSEDTFYFFGNYYTPEQADRDFQDMRQALTRDVQAAGYPTLWNAYTPGGWALDHLSLYDWIETRVPGGHSSPFGQLLEQAYVIEYGGDSRDQSSLNLVYLLGFQASPGNMSIFGASDERYHITGGNQQVPLRIAQLLGNVQTGWALQAVAANPDGSVTLSFSGKRAVTCDYAVLCLPFAVLRTIDTSRAGFDDRKNLAIQQLGRSSNGKLQLQYSSRLWNQPGGWPTISTGSTYADTGYQATWEVSRGQGGASGILVDYTGGSVTDAMTTQVPWSTSRDKNVRTDAQRFQQQINPVYPGLGALWNGKATSSLPKLDPNLLLAYSFWRVGQYTLFSGYEKVRQGNVLFAGEHCSQDFQGYMEGGATEGKRAALEILAGLK